jgi:archaellum component FlaF (FlaF/FlaG flagellin family)
MLKGVSEMIAVVLIIAFTVAVGGILSVWILAFSRQQSATVGTEAQLSVFCSYARVAFSDVKYCSTTSRISGNIKNTGSVLLGEVKMNIILTNGTVLDYPLCEVDTKVIECSTANLTISVGGIETFNLTTSSNYNIIRVITNCSAYSGGATDELDAGDVTLSC